jgi:hypothetical protein
VAALAAEAQRSWPLGGTASALAYRLAALRHSWQNSGRRLSSVVSENMAIMYENHQRFSLVARRETRKAANEKRKIS